MNVNCGNVEKEGKSLNITNVNLLVRFNKTREIFPSDPSFKHFPKNNTYQYKCRKVSCSIPAASYVQR